MAFLLLASAMLQSAPPAVAPFPTFGFNCRMVTADGDIEEAVLEVRLPSSASANGEQPAQVTVERAGAAALPGVVLPQTVEGTNRSTTPNEPGYVQFAVNSGEATYLLAVHVATGNGLPAGFFVSRSVHADWRRNWYWASGFCTPQPGNAQ